MQNALPEDVQYAERQPDGSDVLIFGDKTAWVLSECGTCRRASLIEILRKEGRVIGLRFLQGPDETLPPEASVALETDRKKRADEFRHAWDEAEEAGLDSPA